MQFLKRFFNATDDGGYGYASDEVKVSPFNFGLNAGTCRLVKFEWIPNGGKEGAEQEALDIVFNINGTDKNYRKFPINKVYDKNNNEITDTTSKEYAEARKEASSAFNAVIVHILHAFREDDEIKAALSRPIKSFKEFCQLCAQLLPTNFKDVPLDIFLQYQWSPSPNQNRTFLEIPKKMSYGAWLKPAQPGNWTEKRVPAEELNDQVRKALWYENENGDIHPFTKNGWFMRSPFANQQSLGGDTESNDTAASNMNAGTTDSSASTGNAVASAW